MSKAGVVACYQLNQNAIPFFLLEMRLILCLFAIMSSRKRVCFLRKPEAIDGFISSMTFLIVDLNQSLSKEQKNLLKTRMKCSKRLD